MKTTNIATGGTNLHDQKGTNLCAYFTTMSALRHQLKKYIGCEKSTDDGSKLMTVLPRKINYMCISKDLHIGMLKEFQEVRDLSGMSIKVLIEALDDKFKLFERCLAVVI